MADLQILFLWSSSIILIYLIVCLLTVQVCNAYTELNDPVVQRQRFAEQLKVQNARCHSLVYISQYARSLNKTRQCLGSTIR